MEPIIENLEVETTAKSVGGTTKEELESCFKVFDVNEKNKVDINELLKIKPENDTLKKMQHSKWATSNNLFDYNSFINDFYALIEEFNSYKDRTEPDKQSESQEEKALGPISEVLSTLKGSFFFNGENVISHQYSMVLNKTSKLKISLHMNTRNDCEIFIFGIKQEKSEINYKFIDKTELFVSSESETSEFKTKWEGTLEKGVYVLIPSTTGCLFRKRKNQPSSDIHLTSIESESEEIILTEKYQNAIIEIFHQLDLDDNETLSRAEFNLYNWRTSSMELTDDDWNNLVKKLHIANDEITLDQFLELHKLEAKNGESVELWMALWTMGYNHNLQRDESFDFQIQISSQYNPMLKVFGLRGGGMLLEKATISWIMDGAEKLYAGSHQQIILYLKNSTDSMSVVAQNSSKTDNKVELDFSKSENSIINHPHKKFSIHLPKSSVVFLAHLIKDDIKANFRPKVAIKTK